MVRLSSRVILKPKSDQYWSTIRTTLAKQAGHFPVTYLPGELGEWGDVSPWGYGANILFRCKDHQVVYAHESILTRCSAFIKDLFLMSDARNNQDPFGRTVVVLPDITSDILKQSLRILYVGEETFCFTKTPWDTVQAIIDVFERIFKIKWNLSEPDEESLKAKVNTNKSKKRKSEAISEKERKGKIGKKGHSDENRESIASLYTEARKNVLKLQSFLTNNTADGEGEKQKQVQKPDDETNSSEGSNESCDDNPNVKGKPNAVANYKHSGASPDLLNRRSNEKETQLPAKIHSQTDALKEDVQKKEETQKTSSESKIDIQVEDSEAKSRNEKDVTSASKTGETNSAKKLKQTKINEMFFDSSKATKAFNLNDSTEDMSKLCTNSSVPNDITAVSNDIQLKVDTNSNVENAPNMNRSLLSDNLHSKNIVLSMSSSDKGAIGKTEEKENIKTSSTQDEKDISILRNYSPELHKNILVLQCYKCDFSTNMDQTFNLHMETIHKSGLSMHVLLTPPETEDGKVHIAKEAITNNVESLEADCTSARSPVTDVSSSFTVVLNLLTEGIMKGLEGKMEIESNKEEHVAKSIKGSVQSCEMCTFQCKLRMQLSKHVKAVHC